MDQIRLKADFAVSATDLYQAWLDPGARILQSWRTTDFAEDQADTLLELTLQDTTSGCTLTLVNNGFPAGQVDECRRGWEE